MSANQSSYNNKQQIVTSNPKVGYYNSGLRKFLDFLIGGAGIYFFYWIIPGINIYIDLILVAIASIIFVRIGRKFITIGMLSVVLLALLAIGSCMLSMSNY